MDDLKYLKTLERFLIKRFLWTMVFVSLGEYLMILLINATIVPFAERFFFAGVSSEKIEIAGIFYLFLYICASLILELLRFLLPSRFQQIFAGLLSGLSGFFSRRGNSSMIIGIGRMGTVKEVLLLINLLAVVVLLGLPFFIGAIYFSKIVIRQFKQIEAGQIKKQKEYEQKRNLMLSDIAHDLRTPITTVNGYAKALSDGLVSEERKQEYLSAIMAKSQRMNELITYLFDYVKTDSAGFSLKKEKTDVCELVRECVAMSYQDFEDARIEPAIEIPEEQYMIMADRLQLTRCITNLLSNAIRHNQKNTPVAVVVEKREGSVFIMVADNGEAISPKEAEHIFEPFVMGDESRSSKGGSGLGLAIAKKIIELHGGEISLVQQPALKNTDVIKTYEKAFMIRISA